MKNHANKMSVFAPLTGQIITLEQVPDPVFSGKMLGDGIAIVPEEGKIYSPVNGIVTTVSTTLHAYGFSTTEGLDILVHVGLETVSLNGDGFKSYVKEGDAIFYRKDCVLPVPFLKQNLWTINENQVLAVVNEHLTKRFNYGR